MHALSGIKVLDLTRLLPGAVATLMLGDFGAEVIKIEEPRVGDPMRHSIAGIEQPDAYFLATNRNKKSLTLNLKDERGKTILRDLVKQADVLIEGFRPGVMARLGLAYETLCDLNPRLIYCALTGYGQDGPYQQKPGHDVNYLSTAGVLGVIGQPEGAPAMPGVQLADLAGGSLHAVIGILLALQARAQTGVGQFVDVAMLDGVLSLLYLPLASYLANGKQPPRGADGLSGKYACYHLYETRDGRWLALGMLEPKFWQAACAVLECEAMVAAQFDHTQQPAMIATLQAKFLTRSAAEWLTAFAGVDTCIALVNDIAEMLDDPQIKARGMITEIEHATAGLVKMLAPTVRLSDTPGRVHTPPPCLGEHTNLLLQGLGFAPAQIETLRQDGVI